MKNPAAEAYKRQQIMTATPETLTLMLYDGCLRFLNEGIKELEQKQFEAANTSLIKAQRIISEFKATLKMEYDIAKQLLPLYNYCTDRIFLGNMRSDASMIKEAAGIIGELRDAWLQAMKKARAERGDGNRREA